MRRRSAGLEGLAFKHGLENRRQFHPAIAPCRRRGHHLCRARVFGQRPAPKSATPPEHAAPPWLPLRRLSLPPDPARWASLFIFPRNGPSASSATHVTSVSPAAQMRSASHPSPSIASTAARRCCTGRRWPSSARIIRSRMTPVGTQFAARQAGAIRLRTRWPGCCFLQRTKASGLCAVMKSADHAGVDGGPRAAGNSTATSRSTLMLEWAQLEMRNRVDVIAGVRGKCFAAPAHTLQPACAGTIAAAQPRQPRSARIDPPRIANHRIRFIRMQRSRTGA